MEHVAWEQPIGRGIKLPFAKKPLATTGKDKGIMCNWCTTFASLPAGIIEKLEMGIVPREITEAIEKWSKGYWLNFVEDKREEGHSQEEIDKAEAVCSQYGSVEAYGEHFPTVLSLLFTGFESKDYVLVCAARYRRE